jgi:Cytosolic carboxypeptidase N-terminal domain
LKRSDSRNSSSSRLGIAAVGTAIEPSQPALDNVLFDADFECGNIDQVRKRRDCEFDIWIRNDTNGTNNLQWFMFRMKNTGDFMGTVKINIVNFTKANSLFLNVSVLT